MWAELKGRELGVTVELGSLLWLGSWSSLLFAGSQPYNSPAADELIIRVGIVGAHLVAIICVIILVLIVISLVFSRLQRDLQQHTCGSEKQGRLLHFPHPAEAQAGSLPPPLPHCTSGSAATVPPQPACHSPGSSRSPPSWSQGQQGEREDTIRSGRLRQAGKRPRERLGILFYTLDHAEATCSFVLSPGKTQGLLGKARGGFAFFLSPLYYSSSQIAVLQCSFQVRAPWEESLVVQLL